MMDDSIFIGNRHTYGGFRAPYHFPIADFMRHVHVIGKTGTGKSSLLQLFILGLIHSGCGVGVLDPHGDLANWVLGSVPRERLDDVVYLNLADTEFPPALNLVSDSIPVASRPRVASALVSAFRHIWSESWGPRLEYILYHSLRVLIDCQNVSLVALPRLLTDSKFRGWVVSQCQDPFIRGFWAYEYEAWDKRFRAEAIAPIQNKLGQLAAIPALRNVLGQTRMKVDFSDILDNSRILVVDLAKGKLGDEASRLLGALITSSLGAAAMERGSPGLNAPRPFVFIMDEAHCFISGATASLLSESRKFGLGLVLAHQYLGQLSPSIRDSVLANAGSVFAFRLSGDDAAALASNFGHSWSLNQFVETPPFSAAFRSVQPTALPFRIDIPPPEFINCGYRHSIAARSRERFCTSRALIEDKLRRWTTEDSQ